MPRLEQHPCRGLGLRMAGHGYQDVCLEELRMFLLSTFFFFQDFRFILLVEVLFCLFSEFHYAALTWNSIC